jgi:hypothetical protein
MGWGALWGDFFPRTRRGTRSPYFEKFLLHYGHGTANPNDAKTAVWYCKKKYPYYPVVPDLTGVAEKQCISYQKIIKNNWVFKQRLG